MAFSGKKEKCHNSGLEGPNPKISKPIINPLPSAFRQKKIWANSTFLWAANRDSAKVVEKSVKSEAKCKETAPKLEDFISWARNKLFGYFQGSRHFGGFCKKCQNIKTLYLGLGMAKLRTFKGKNHLLAMEK